MGRPPAARATELAPSPARAKPTHPSHRWSARGLPAALGFWLVLGLGCKSDSERAELAEVARLVEHIDRLRRADNADKQPLLAALLAAECRGIEACALKDLCVRAYRQHQDALDGIAALKQATAPDAVPEAAKAQLHATPLEAIERDLAEARGLAERCAEEQVRVVRKRLM